MIQRPTQASIYNLVRSGLELNLGKLARAQEMVATGKSILRPSDDAVGTSAALSVHRQKGGVSAYLSAITTARPHLATASSQLQSASAQLTEARALIVQGMSGTLADEDREALAGQLELLVEGLIEIGNSRSGERFLFAGTETATQPFHEVVEDGRHRVVYRGNSTEQSILIGRDVELQLNVPGEEIFGRFEYTGVGFAGMTGVSTGVSASSGEGFHDVHVRHDVTTGAPTEGIALAAGGADDTIVGPHTVTIDGVNGMAQLGSGPKTSIGTPLPTDLTLRDADGSTVDLDFSAWSGASTSFVLTGEASLAFNGGAYQAITLTETDLELVDEGRGAVLHLNTTGITRAATELVTYRGTANIFDSLAGVAEDLRNEPGLPLTDALERARSRLGEFDRNHKNLLIATGRLGARTDRLDTTEARLQDLHVHLESLVSRIEDADLTTVVLDMNKADQTLQVAQATGARLLQQTLLNFLR